MVWFCKAKNGEKAKLYYMDTGSFIVYIKTDDIYKDIAEDVEIRFDTSKYKLDKPLPKERNEKVIGLVKDELDSGLREKTYTSLIDDCSQVKNPKSTKKGVIKRKHKFENYRNWLEATQLENKINHLKKIKLAYIVLKGHKEYL